MENELFYFKTYNNIIILKIIGVLVIFNRK
jgi:hypothetical protein